MDTTSTTTVEAPAKQYKLSDLILEGSEGLPQNIHRYVDFTFEVDGSATPLSACANGAAFLALMRKLDLPLPKREDGIEWDRTTGPLDASFKTERGTIQALSMLDAYVTAPLLQPTTREQWDALTEVPDEPLADPDSEEGGDFHFYTTPPEYVEEDAHSYALSRAIDYANYNKSREKVADILSSLGM